MLRWMSFQNLSVTRKLLVGFGLLLVMGVILSMVGFYGLHNSDQSLKRISRLGAIGGRAGRQLWLCAGA